MALPDELLEEIFLRLPTAADLARTSTACVSFRRVITGHPFLRRFRVLHPSPLLGILCGGLIPAQPPHPSAATLAGTDFSCPFLPPSPDRWCRRDVRGGRALFSPALEGTGDFPDPRYLVREFAVCDPLHRRDVRDGRALFSPALEGTGDFPDPRDLVREFVVCDPLHRRYLLLPALPDHLAGQVHPPEIVQCDPFLAPPGDYEEDSSFTDFRVMCLVRCTAKLVLFVFSSCAGRWLADPITFDEFGGYASSHRYYAHGCFCWQVCYADKLLVLDARRMEFSAVDLLPLICRTWPLWRQGKEGLGFLLLSLSKLNVISCMMYSLRMGMAQTSGKPSL